MVNASDESSTDYGNFKLLQSFDINYAPVKISKWRSEKTGLTVVVGSHAAPITNGHFTIASEIFDDTGRPHTLEHLIFLGSKQFPYKGVLDQLANRAGSNGTNAWTATDHTAYTMATAGSEGFLNMLPIYIDHILHPTITDAGFVTEVHHINGKGEDAGVVYSEMQARENQSGDLIALQLQRMLYPQTSAYRSETGGLMAKLRVLTAEQIRQYHSQYYVPHNLCLLIDGAVPLPDLFTVLNEKVDPLIQSHLPNPSSVPPPAWKRPFVETSTSRFLDIAESRTKVVEFMEEDESMGEVYLTFLGPAPTDYRTNLAIGLMGSYLTHSATAPLEREFIEIPKPYSTGIGFYSEDRVNKNEMTVYALDVPTKHLDALGGMISSKLKRIVEIEGVDMDRMARIIRRDKRKLLNSMEMSVSSVLSDVIIGDFLYGSEKGEELPKAFDDLRDYAALGKWGPQDWASLLNRFYVAAPYISVIGRPSAALAAKIDKDEKERVFKRKADMGEDRLKELEKAVEKAKEESDTPPPPEMIQGFPITNPAGLTWIPVETAISSVVGQQVTCDGGDLQRYVDKDGVQLPIQAHFSGIKSNFVNVSVLFDTVKIPSHLKPYLSVFSNALFSLSLRQADGKVLSHEDVVDQLDDFTVGQSVSFAYRGCFSEVLVVSLKVQKGDYESAVAWIRDLVSGCIFTKERLSVIVAKSLQELPYQKRDGKAVARAWANRLAFDMDKSTSEACSLLNLLEFTPAIVKALDDEPDIVLKRMEEARKHLLDPSIMRISVTGDVMSLPSPKAPLAKAFGGDNTTALAPLSTSRDTLTPLGEQPANKLVLVPMSAIEGSYAVHLAKGPVGWAHPDMPALTLASAVLNATESYLWKSIRGSGLAYEAQMEVDAESGLTGYSVYRSPDARAAYEEAGKLLRGLADGTVELDQNIVDGARSTLTYGYAKKSETVFSAASTAYVNEVLKQVGKNYDQMMLQKLPSITLQQIREVVSRYFLPIFDPETSIGAVSVSAGKADELEEGYKRLGYQVERRELPSFGEGDEESGDESMGSGDEKSEDGMEGLASP